MKSALRSLTLFLLLATNACGFQPLMGRSGAAHEELGQIQILPVPDRSGQILRNRLTNDLGPRGTERRTYMLEVRLSEPRQEIAIRRDETASRVSYTANAVFSLRDAGGKLLMSGNSSSSSTFEATNSEFASISAQQNARDRALEEISADIRNQLASYFVRQASAK